MTSPAPSRKLRPVPLSNVRLTTGFWADRFEICRQTMVPNMWSLLRDPEISHAFTNFRIAAGLEAGQHKGPKWHDGDLYKWLEAAAHVYAQTREPALDDLMDEVIGTIRKAQRSDGYIHTPAAIAAQSRDPSGAFQDRLHFETYNMGHLMTAACAHHNATGKSSLLETAIAAADFLYAYYQANRHELARNAVCPSHYMGVVDLYRQNGEPRYLELARSLVEIRDLVTGGGDDNQDRLPFRQQEHVVGHAVRANYLYAGAADIAMETGDPTLLETLENLWTDLTTTKMHVTGGCGALYDGASPDGAVDQSTITRVHQAYGRAYQLPNVTAHNETCANIGNLLWNWRMLAITGETRYADVGELALYNSALASISLDGRRFFYTNPLRRVGDLPFELRWGRVREAYIDCFCCPPNIVRTIAQVGAYLYSISEEGIWANLYAGSRADLELDDGKTVHILQETDYPWEGHVRLSLQLQGAANFGLMLRIPGWCPAARIAVNGVPLRDEPVPGQYARIDRRWESGDSVDLELAMPVQFLESHPLVEETRNHLAVRRGPLIYCLESLDLPAGVRFEEVYLSPQAVLDPQPAASFEGLIDDIRTLKGPVSIIPGERWHGQLYRPAQTRQSRQAVATLIPYFAWDNRGASEMTVWLPEAIK